MLQGWGGPRCCIWLAFPLLVKVIAILADDKASSAARQSNSNKELNSIVYPLKNEPKIRNNLLFPHHIQYRKLKRASCIYRYTVYPPVLPLPTPAQASLLFLNLYITLSFLNKITVSGFLYVKTMTKWFYSQFWKWLNLTIVFYDNLCFRVPGLLLYQHFFFLPQIWTISYLCIGWKQIPLPGRHFNGEEHASLKSPEPLHLNSVIFNFSLTKNHSLFFFFFGGLCS